MPVGRRVGLVARIASILAIALVVSGALTACQQDSTPHVEVDPASTLGLPKLIGLETIVQPETRVLDDEALTALDDVTILNLDECFDRTETHKPCEFRLTFATLPDGLKVGSVVVAGVSDATPNGLLATVTAIDDTTVLATEATIGDALRQGEFRVEKSFSSSDVTSEISAPGVTGGSSIGTSGSGGTHRKSFAVPRADGFGFNYSLDTDIADGVHATGTVGFDIGCGAYGGLTWKKVWKVPVYPNGVYFEAKCGVTQDGALTITGTAGKTLDQSYEVTRLSLEPISFFVGPVPVVLVPEIIVSIDAHGKVGAQMSVGVSEHFGAVVGINYSDGFHVIKDFSSDFSKTVSTGSARLSLTAGVVLSQSLLLYGIVGPSLIEEAYLDLQGKPQGEKPIWCMNGGLKASVSIGIDLGIKYLGFGPEELFNWTKELGCAGNTAPTVTITQPFAGAGIYPGTGNGALHLVGQAWDEEDGALTLHWSSDIDGTLGTTTSGKDLTINDLSLGQHTITVYATDSDGATTTKSVVITAKDGAPSVSVTMKDAAGNWAPVTSISGAKGDLVYIRLVPASPVMLTFPSCDDVVWSGALPVTSTSGCDFSVSLNQQGSFTLGAQLTDQGKIGSASLMATVGPAPAVITPQFSPITATNQSGQPIYDNLGAMGYGDVATLKINYTNGFSAQKTVTYSWSIRTTSSGQQPGEWKAMGSTDAATLSGSSRSFTAPKQYGKVYYYEILVTMKNATTGADIGSKSFRMSYVGPPA
jgi:hypothetical protein